MNASIYRISLELQEPHSNVLLNVKRGDTNRRLHISLTDGGHPYQISEECTAVFTAVKPDGAKIFNHCQILDNEIIYTTTPQTVAAEGTCECEIKLYGADDRLLTSARFDLVVNETVYNEGDEIESTDEFNELARLIGEASAVPASVLLQEGDSLDVLLENGRYYCTGGTVNGLIRQLMTDAGITLPAVVDEEPLFACALFVDVTRQERQSGGPDDLVGQPCQHLTVYFNKDKTTDYWKYEYHRAHNMTGSNADGTSWGGWYSPTKCELETEKEVFTAEYGVTTYAEIKAAYDADAVCKCRNGNRELRLEHCGGPAGAIFSGIWTNDTSTTTGDRVLLYTYVCSFGDVWREATHYLADLDDIPDVINAITESSTDEQIPTAKAVYDAIKATGALFVTVTGRVQTGFTADKTHEELYAAYRAERPVIAYWSGQIYVATGWDPGGLAFEPMIQAHTSAANIRSLKVTPGDAWSFYDTANPIITTEVSEDSTRVPTAKAVYDALEERETHSFDGAEILFDGDVTLTDAGNGYWVYYFDAPLGVTYGETYTLIADGVITTATVSKDNAFFASAVGGNNAFLYYDCVVVCGDNLKSFNLKVAHGAGEIHHLDAMYIPSAFPRLGVAGVGQMVMVSAVDADGKPTAWEAAKPLRLDADLADTYLADSSYGDAALAAIKAGRQILVRVPNADGGNFTAIYSPILMYQVPNYANKYLYLFFLRDEKQDLSSLGIPVQMPTYGELKMLLSQEYNEDPLAAL